MAAVSFREAPGDVSDSAFHFKPSHETSDVLPTGQTLFAAVQLSNAFFRRVCQQDAASSYEVEGSLVIVAIGCLVIHTVTLAWA